MTHAIQGGVSGCGGVKFRRSICINRIHRGFLVRRAMSVGSCLLVSLIEAFESFPRRYAYLGKGVDLPGFIRGLCSSNFIVEPRV